MEDVWVIVDSSLSVIWLGKTERMCALKLKRLTDKDYFVQHFKWNGFGFAFVKQITNPVATKNLEIIKGM